MINFRKILAASAGKLVRAYYTENTPEPIHDPDRTPGRHPDLGGRLTAYFTGRDSRATWRPDMAASVARALGVDHRRMPKDADLDHLFEAKRADTGEAWSQAPRDISAVDFVTSVEKSVSLAITFARSDEERAARMISWALDARYVDPLMRGQGRDDIAAMIATACARLPGHDFALAGTPDGHGDHVRFSWTLAPDGGAPVPRRRRGSPGRCGAGALRGGRTSSGCRGRPRGSGGGTGPGSGRGTRRCRR